MPLDSSADCSPSRPEPAWRVFWHAATRPSVPAAVGTLVVLVSMFLAGVRWIRLDWLAGLPVGTFLESPIDNHGVITWTALKIRRSRPRTTEHAVAIIGGSTVLHALEDDATLQAGFAERLGEDARIYNLCGGALRLPDYISLVDNVKDHIGGAIVFNVSMRHLMVTEETWAQRRSQPFVGLPSALLDEETHRLGLENPPQFGNYFLDQHEFLAPRLLPGFHHLVSGPIEPTRYINLGPQAGALRMFELRMEHYSDLRDRIYAEHHERNLAVIARMIAAIRAGRGARVVLLESPLNPRYEKRLDLDPYRETMEAFARAEGVEYWSLARRARLRAPDFEDYGHVHTLDARVRYTALLLDRLAKLLRGETPS